MLLLLAVAWGGVASELARVNRIFEDARRSSMAAQTNAVLAWQFGRACFDRADFATNNAERTAIAEQGIAACRRALDVQPDFAPAHYYLAMNRGQLARTRTLAALKLVDEMEAGFKTARALDERFDFAGPDRNLGLLYLEAPGWPASIGNRTRARQHLQRAVELAPDYPGNRLHLLEAYLRWSDRNGVRRELKALDELWTAARAQFVGEAWTAAWVEWEKRLKQARAKAGETPAALVAPRLKE